MYKIVQMVPALGWVGTSIWVKNIVTKDIGFLSEDVNTEAYLKALECFLNTNNNELNRIKENCKRLYGQEFSMESCAEKYDALYHALKPN